MKDTVSFIRIAQLEDELSEAFKVIDLVTQERDKAISDKDLAVAQAVQEYKDEISRIVENHKREIEQKDAFYMSEMAKVNDSHKNAMIAKDLKIQSLLTSNGTVAETSRKTIEDITSKVTGLELSLSQKISQNLWYRQRYWGKDSEQARLLQNRHSLTRGEEKALFMQNITQEEHQDCTAELDTTRRKNRKSKKPRLDYSKNKAYTDHPVHIKLEDSIFCQTTKAIKRETG